MERILTPQLLDEVEPADQSILPNITPGYTGGARNLKKDGRMKLDPRFEWTGGGLTTNPTMLVLFYSALADGQVVRPESLVLMLESGYRDPANPEVGHRSNSARGMDAEAYRELLFPKPAWME